MKSALIHPKTILLKCFFWGVTLFMSMPAFAINTHTLMHHKLIENMTWSEVAELQKSTKVIIIPLGAQAKEHGLHLPLNNDYIMANYLRNRVLEKLNHALALPTINYSYYPSFLEYPGSTSVNAQASQQVIVDICRSLAQQGFKKFYILNVGFSTIKPLAAAKKKLSAENIAMEYLTPQDFFDSPVIKRLEQQKRGSHADEIETSMMLYMAPQIVHREKAVKDDNLDVPGPLTRHPNSSGLYSPTGAWGDPTLATSEKGKIITEAFVEYILKQVNQFVEDL